MTRVVKKIVLAEFPRLASRRGTSPDLEAMSGAVERRRLVTMSLEYTKSVTSDGTKNRTTRKIGRMSFYIVHGHDLGKSLLDGEAVAHQGSTVRFGQRHPSTQPVAQNLVLLPEGIVLPDQVGAEQLLDGGDQWNDRLVEVGGHA